MEKILQTVAAVGAAIITFAFGGWSGLLTVLLVFVIFDYVTGVAAAGKGGEISSKVGFWGIIKKIIIFGIVTIGHFVDLALGTADLVMDAVIYFYLSNELISILENAGEIGVPLPPILEKAIAIFKEKGDGEIDGI